MELDPNLPLYQKEALLNPQPEEGAAKLRAVLEMTGKEQPEKERVPIPNINGTPFLREVVGGENIPEPDSIPDFNQNRLSRGNFEPIILDEKPKIETPVPQGEKLFDDPLILKQDVVVGDSLEKILKRILIGNN